MQAKPKLETLNNLESAARTTTPSLANVDEAPTQQSQALRLERSLLAPLGNPDFFRVQGSGLAFTVSEVCSVGLAVAKAAPQTQKLEPLIGRLCLRSST